MTNEKEKELKKLLYEELEYWVEQYKLNNKYREQIILDALKSGDYKTAQKLSEDNSESERISKNIVIFERAYNRL